MIYRLYVGLALSIIALTLAFRHTLTVLPIDMHSKVDTDFFRFLLLALTAFYLPLAMAFALVLRVTSRKTHP